MNSEELEINLPAGTSSEIVDEYKADTKWMYPYISNDELCKTHDISQICNEERRRRMHLAINHQMHPSNYRDFLLKKYFDSHMPIKWLALVADVSMPTAANHYTGSILLNHLVEHKKSLFQTLFIETNQIDYHMWLQISRIKYFREADSLQIAVGDVIVGHSWIKKYFKEKDHSCHYGLGKTIITDCGIPVVEFPPTNSVAIDLPQAKIISDYNRHDDYVAEISYPDYYRSILNRYRKVTIQTLQFIKGSIHAFYKKSNYTNYHDILNYKNIVKLN